MAKSKNPGTKTEKNLMRVCAMVRSLLSKADRADLVARYKVAVHIASVADASKYGDNAISKMEQILHRDKSSLYRYAAVANAWSEVEFKELVGRLDKEKPSLTWSHLELLAGVMDGRVRHGLIERLLRESLTFSELRAMLKERGGGTPQAVLSPSTPMPVREVALRLGRWVCDVEKEVDSWGDSLPGDVGVAKTELDPAEAAKLSETVNRMSAVAQTMMEMATKLRTILDIVAAQEGQSRELKVLGPSAQPPVM